MKLLLERWRQFIDEQVEPAWGNKLRVFDFDDTLATTSSMVKLMLADGTERMITPGEFAVYKPAEGEYYDEDPESPNFAFSEFNEVRDGEEIRLVANIMRNVVGSELTHPEGRKVAILTARGSPDDWESGAGPAIASFLSDIGIDPDSVPIVTLGSADPMDKKKWIKDQIVKHGFNDIQFFDDSLANVAAVKELQEEHPEIKLQLWHSSDDTLSAMEEGRGHIDC